MALLIQKYFPNLSPKQQQQFEALPDLYQEWNAKINVVSRKDIHNLMEHHVLHALAIAKFLPFEQGTQILDVGTGGGFPGIPLAILFPQSQFTLIDAIGKKIKVVNAVAETIGLKNVEAQHLRVQDLKGQFDYIVSRAVTNLPDFLSMVKGKISSISRNQQPNGILYLKGGDFEEELKKFSRYASVVPISTYFEEPFFETKSLLYLRKEVLKS